MALHFSSWAGCTEQHSRRLSGEDRRRSDGSVAVPGQSLTYPCRSAEKECIGRGTGLSAVTNRRSLPVSRPMALSSSPRHQQGPSCRICSSSTKPFLFLSQHGLRCCATSSQVTPTPRCCHPFQVLALAGRCNIEQSVRWPKSARGRPSRGNRPASDLRSSFGGVLHFAVLTIRASQVHLGRVCASDSLHT